MDALSVQQIQILTSYGALCNSSQPSVSTIQPALHVAHNFTHRTHNALVNQTRRTIRPGQRVMQVRVASVPSYVRISVSPVCIVFVSKQMMRRPAWRLMVPPRHDLPEVVGLHFSHNLEEEMEGQFINNVFHSMRMDLGSKVNHYATMYEPPPPPPDPRVDYMPGEPLPPPPGPPPPQQASQYTRNRRAVTKNHNARRAASTSQAAASPSPSQGRGRAQRQP